MKFIRKTIEIEYNTVSSYIYLYLMLIDISSIDSIQNDKEARQSN